MKLLTMAIVAFVLFASHVDAADSTAAREQTRQTLLYGIDS